MKNIIYIALLLSFTFVGCSSKSIKKEPASQEIAYTTKEINDKPPFRGSDIYEFYQQGKGSWYGKELHGNSTASGERFNMNDFTAAHKSLPFGTIIEVTNIKTGKRINARINDRGPFVPGRVVDLSSAAFSSIASTSQGVVPMEIRIVSYPENRR